MKTLFTIISIFIAFPFFASADAIDGCYTIHHQNGDLDPSICIDGADAEESSGGKITVASTDPRTTKPIHCFVPSKVQHNQTDGSIAFSHEGRVVLVVYPTYGNGYRMFTIAPNGTLEARPASTPVTRALQRNISRSGICKGA